jgi:ATP-dependent helicase/nuclease subunit A
VNHAHAQLSSIELISASAGTGKTYRLTERIVAAVRGGIQPERIMATTFTVKAATELRTRVRLALSAAGSPDLGSRVADAYIGTVHSLCFRLLKEYAIDAGLSPEVNVLPEADAERAFNVAVTAAIESIVDTMEPVARRLCRTGAGHSYSQERDWRDDVRSIVGAARVNGITSDDLRTHARASIELWEDTVVTGGVPPTMDDLVAAAATAVEELEAIADPRKGTQSVLESLRAFLADVDAGQPIPWKRWVDLAAAEPKLDAAGVMDSLHHIANRVCEVPTMLADMRTMISEVFSCAAEALDQFDAYKRDQGLTDYNDMEASFLRVLMDREDVQLGIRERIDIVMVDEFQDTSPMQLSLFLELHRVVGRSIWVGDPKQAIYGFRGTDPALMTQIAALLDSQETLSYSWRSKQAILDLTNAIFTAALFETPKEKIELSLPSKRAMEGRGGRISAWYLDSKKKDDDARAIAAGVQRLLQDHPEYTAGEIAILCRTNPQCAKVADALDELHIRASVSSGFLIETREVQTVLAGVRFLADPNDTIALTELMVLLFPTRELVSELVGTPEETLTAWRTESIPAELGRIGQLGDQLSVCEAVDAVIAATDIMQSGSGWSRPDVRRANIETLRGIAVEYEELQRAARSPASLHDFVAHVGDGGNGQAQGSGPDSCVVTTYHGAKGLEWPVVVLAELDKTFEDSLFGMHTIPAPRVDPAHPLADRRIHYWPWPFGAKKKFSRLNDLLDEIPLMKQINAAQYDESVRLLYVGSTRAKDHLIFAVRNSVSKGLAQPVDSWLQRLTDAQGVPLFQWPTADGNQELSIGGARVPIDITVHAPASDADGADGREAAWRSQVILQPQRGDRRDIARVSRAISPSQEVGIESAVDGVTVTYRAVEVATIAAPISVPGAVSNENPDATSLGSAIHGIFAVSPAHQIPGKAADILRRWEISTELAAPVIRSVDALEAFLSERHNVTAIHREWPVSVQYENGQVLHGWIDLLAETSDGWVIVDHKTHRRAELSPIAEGYGPQLAHYRRAVEAATDKPVVETLINFVLMGTVYEVRGSE